MIAGLPGSEVGVPGGDGGSILLRARTVLTAVDLHAGDGGHGESPS